MVPFPSVENQDSHNRGEGSSNSNNSQATTTSDKLSALPHSTPSPRAPRVSSPSAIQFNRRSLDGDLLNFPSLHMSEFEISPLRRLRDKFGSHTTHGTARISASEGNSPRNGRISPDDEHSPPASRIGRHAFGWRQRTGSDPPPLPPSSLRSPTRATDGDTTPRRHHGGFSSRSPSKSRSRATSPLRFIQTLSAGLHLHHRAEPEEPFVPVNPFRSKLSFSLPFLWYRGKPAAQEPDIELAEASISSNTDSSGGAKQCDDILLISSIKDCIKHGNIFVVDVLPRLIYLNLLLQLPLLYFSRVARIFREAEVSRPDIERMIEVGPNCGPFFDSHLDGHVAHLGPHQLQPPPQYHQAQEVSVTADSRGRRKERGAQPRPGAATGLSVAAHIGVAAATSAQVPVGEPNPQPILTPTLKRFKESWEAFIDSLMREWKTLNVVSALLASAILTIFQIPDAAGDPITRTAAILSLICALMSLTYGCVYIVRFSTMRSMVRASKWAEEARRTNTAILWNVWVLLAMPAIWLAWSMVIFMVSILSFVWRTGSDTDPSQRPPLSRTAALGPRIAITFVAFIGVVYLVLIVRTLKSYGINGGTAQSAFTSPQAGLGALGTADPQHAGPSGERITSHHNHSGLLEGAFERRGRDRTRSTDVRRGRRREEPPEVRGHHGDGRRVPIKELKEGNELGLFSINTNSSAGKSR